MLDDEPFDALDGNGPAVRSKSSTPSAPPSFAFGHGGNMSTPGKSAAPPPPLAFQRSSSALAATPDIMGDEEDELGAIPSKPRASEPSIMSSQLNDRWKQYETKLENHRNESSLENQKSSIEEEPYSNYKVSASTRSELAPRQPYAFGKSQSYDTDELIRKYGGMAGIAAMKSAARPPSSPSAAYGPRTSDVRDQAQKVLNLVDDHLKTPLDVRRTESGGFRAAPAMEDPYSVQRSSSLSGKRVPAALSGLNFSSKSSASNSWKDSGRYSFSDPSFRDDDQISDEEDDIIRGNDGPFQDEPVVDVAGMENRAAGMRPYSDEKKFEGDFVGSSSRTWSSRYSDSGAYVSQKHILDQWDREFEQENGRKSARNMFMSTADNIRSTATNAWSAAGTGKQKIFGSGGFSFRNNHVFGHHAQASEINEINLRSVWREVDENGPPIGPPPVHKTWQEVMLNKRKRRRILAGLAIVIFGVIASWSALAAIKKHKAKASMFAGSDLGRRVTFYVTSDTPFDKSAEDGLVKDLMNIPADSEFVMHLGNIQDASVSMCPQTQYSDVGSILVKSPVPLFIVPGADDWTLCPDQQTSLSQWLAVFEDFDLKFKHAFPVKRDANNHEAFSFLHNGVLFMGLHIVSGPVFNQTEWENRQKDMLKFYFGMANDNKGNFRSVVVFGNARPSAQQAVFFETMFSNLKEHHAPMVYIHANQKGNEVMRSTPFKGHPEVLSIGVQDGSSRPPLKVTVGFGELPFMVG